MKKILVIHTKYRITGGEDIAVDSEIATLKKYFNVETLYFSNKDTDNFLCKDLQIEIIQGRNNGSIFKKIDADIQTSISKQNLKKE